VSESDGLALWLALSSSSFLEFAFLRWVLAPAALPGLASHIAARAEVEVDGRRYRIDYELRGAERAFAVELDGFEFHGTRRAFTYDRLRQNDLQATGRMVVRFSYDSIRLETARCVAQLQAVLRLDPLLARLLVPARSSSGRRWTRTPLAALRPSPTLPGKPRTSKGIDPVTLAGYWVARRRRGRPPLDRARLRLLQQQRGRCPLCGDLLLHADQEPQHPDEWERWITATRTATRHQAIALDTGPGPPDQPIAVRLIHTHCRRRLPDGTGSGPAALLHP